MQTEHNSGLNQIPTERHRSLNAELPDRLVVVLDLRQCIHNILGHFQLGQLADVPQTVVALYDEYARNDRHVYADPSTVVVEFDERLGFEEQLGDDEVGAGVAFLF